MEGRVFISHVELKVNSVCFNAYTGAALVELLPEADCAIDGLLRVVRTNRLQQQA